MVKRASLYLILIVCFVPVGFWLAFGPGIDAPLAVFLWPAERLLFQLSPSAGSDPAFDLLLLAVVSSLLWFCSALLIDIGIVAIARRLRPGG